MKTLEIVMGIVVLVLAAVLTTAVLLQSGNEKKSGVVMGNVDTYIGKNRAGKNDRLLSKVTTILAIVFVIAVVATYIIVAKYA